MHFQPGASKWTSCFASQFDFVFEPRPYPGRHAPAVVAEAHSISGLTRVLELTGAAERLGIDGRGMMSRRVEGIGFPLRDVGANLRQETLRAAELSIVEVGFDDRGQPSDDFARAQLRLGRGAISRRRTAHS